MVEIHEQRWLKTAERYLGWIAIPNIALIFVTLQALGFLMVAANPVWAIRLALVPDMVVHGGEYWRLVTFLSLPISMSPIWVIFVLWFLYFILNLIEQEWGAFKTTFYTLVSIGLSILFSFLFSYPITQVSHFESTLFLAAAVLYPEYEVRLFLIFPVKMKWLAGLTAVFLGMELLSGNWIDRLYLLSIYSNFVLFFAPAFWSQFKLYQRRRKFKNQMRN